MDDVQLGRIIEAALLAADEPLSEDRLAKLFRPDEVDKATLRPRIRDVLTRLGEEASGRGYELKRVASGYRYQVRQELSAWVSRLWEEKPPRYSRALLETLALIAYRQPATRGDIEQVRGVGVSANIMRTLLERGWIREVGRREVAGRPALYGTTKAFLDYFNLKSLDELPPLAEIRELIEPRVDVSADASADESADASADDLTDQGAHVQPTTAGSEASAVETEAADDADVGLEEPPRAEVVPLPTPQR